MSAEQSKLSFEPSPRLTCVSRAGSPSLLSARSPASPAGPLRGSRQGAFKDAPPLLSRSFGWARKGARIGVISLLAAAAVLSSCIGGNALQGTPVQDPSVVTFLSNFTARDQWWEAPRRPKAEDLAGLDPEKVYFETCLLQKLGESWTIWDTRDLRSHQSAVRLAVFRTRRGPKWAGWQAGSATCGLKSAAVGRPPDSINTVSSPCYHIVESWDIEKMMEEPPTDAYYEALAKDLRDRRKKACPHLLDHLVSLEAFLDKSILFGSSFGINKAEVCVAEGRLLGHKIGRNGSAPDEERCQAVVPRT